MNETRIIRLEHGIQDLVTQDVGQQREHGHHLEEEEHSRRHCHYVRLGKIVQKILMFTTLYKTTINLNLMSLIDIILTKINCFEI